MSATTVKLTKKETELLQHRADCSDAIGDHIEEVFAESKEHEESLWRAFEEVEKMLAVGEIANTSPDVAIILAELADGSTWVASGEGWGLSDQQSAANNRIANSVEKKLASIGIDVSIPRH